MAAAVIIMLLKPDGCCADSTVASPPQHNTHYYILTPMIERTMDSVSFGVALSYFFNTAPGRGSFDLVTSIDSLKTSHMSRTGEYFDEADFQVNQNDAPIVLQVGASYYADGNSNGETSVDVSPSSQVGSISLNPTLAYSIGTGNGQTTNYRVQADLDLSTPVIGHVMIDGDYVINKPIDRQNVSFVSLKIPASRAGRSFFTLTYGSGGIVKAAISFKIF